MILAGVILAGQGPGGRQDLAIERLRAFAGFVPRHVYQQSGAEADAQHMDAVRLGAVHHRAVRKQGRNQCFRFGIAQAVPLHQFIRVVLRNFTAEASELLPV